ncbi:MAG: DNA-directed DNA polymerase II small subunit [Thermoproteota archaeon]
MENKERKKLIVEALSRKGFVIDAKALDYLASKKDLNIGEFIDYLAKDIDGSNVFISKRDLEEALQRFGYSEYEYTSSPITASKRAIDAEAASISSDIKVLFNVEKVIQPSDEVDSKKEYLVDRFRKLERILRSRLDVTGVVSISEARRSSDRTKVKIIAMVSEVRNENYILLEDLKSSAYLIIPRSAPDDLKIKAQRLHPDLVACFELVVLGGKFICLDIILPDLPESKPNTSPERVSAVLISDLHIGSSYFMEKAFQLFLNWLNGKIGGSESMRAAGEVKYVVIAGDLVDGVGVYPQQEKELSIRDVKTQYKKAAELLQQIPDHIEIIIIPGNHDATLKALPQPPIPDEYSAPLRANNNVTLLSNPTLISLHGVKFLITHGTSIEDLANRVPGLDYSNPHLAMCHLLAVRHLAPIYGGRTPINTDKEDMLVIDERPDVFHAGHVHIFKLSRYRGVIVTNSGCWQKMTPYQQALGYVPTPGIFSLIHLDSLRVDTVPILTEARAPT